MTPKQQARAAAFNETVLGHCRITHAHAARLLGVSARQYARYKSGTCALPAASARLLWLAGADMSALLGDQWRGWKWANGQIYDPGGRPFNPGEIAAIPHLYDAIHALRAELRHLLEDTDDPRRDTY